MLDLNYRINKDSFFINIQEELVRIKTLHDLIYEEKESCLSNFNFSKEKGELDKEKRINSFIKWDDLYYKLLRRVENLLGIQKLLLLHNKVMYVTSPNKCINSLYEVLTTLHALQFFSLTKVEQA